MLRIPLEAKPVAVCGHTYWREALAELDGGVEVLKVDGRVVVLTRADEDHLSYP